MTSKPGDPPLYWSHCSRLRCRQDARTRLTEPPAPVAATPVNQTTAGSISVQGPLRRQCSGRATGQHGQHARLRPAAYGAGLRPLTGRYAKVGERVVYIKEASRVGCWRRRQTVVLDQKGCLYEPRVTAAMVGQAVEFENEKRSRAHNVHGKPSVVAGWNFMMSRQGQQHTLLRQARDGDSGRLRHPPVDACLSLHRAESLLRRERARRVGTDRKRASRQLHHRRLAREPRHNRTEDHPPATRRGRDRLHLSGSREEDRKSKRQSGQVKGKSQAHEIPNF